MSSNRKWIFNIVHALSHSLAFILHTISSPFKPLKLPTPTTIINWCTCLLTEKSAVIRGESPHTDITSTHLPASGLTRSTLLALSYMTIFLCSTRSCPSAYKHVTIPPSLKNNHGHSLSSRHHCISSLPFVAKLLFYTCYIQFLSFHSLFDIFKSGFHSHHFMYTAFLAHHCHSQ